MATTGRHERQAEQRGPFCGLEGAERQGEGGKHVWSTTIMLGVIYQNSETKGGAIPFQRLRPLLWAEINKYCCTTFGDDACE